MGGATIGGESSPDSRTGNCALICGSPKAIAGTSPIISTASKVVTIPGRINVVLIVSKLLSIDLWPARSSTHRFLIHGPFGRFFSFRGSKNFNGQQLWGSAVP